MSTSNIKMNKYRVWEYWSLLNSTSQTKHNSIHQDYLSPDLIWFGPHPFNSITGREALEFCFYKPLFHSFPDLHRKTDIFMSGNFRGKEWVSATGHFIGTFTHDWLGIPANGKVTYIRFGQFSRIEEGKIVETRILFDLIDLMRQVGIHVLPPSAGTEWVVPGPQKKDGVLLSEQDPTATQKSLELVESMIFGLMTYDQSNLNSMGMERFWDPDKMVWYGPTGIGTTYGLDGFQKDHQQPFLHAFPDRKGGFHVSRFAEGHYIASTGWPSVLTTHKGEYLGTQATGKKVGMRVMDWWKREEDLLTENWVFIDLPHLFLQFGIDLFARIHIS